jgi:hypothetical protein
MLHGRRLLFPKLHEFHLSASAYVHGRRPAMFHEWSMLFAKLHELRLSKSVFRRQYAVCFECRVLLAKLFERHLQSSRQLHSNGPILPKQRPMLFAKMHELYMPAVTLGR